MRSHLASTAVAAPCERRLVAPSRGPSPALFASLALVAGFGAAPARAADAVLSEVSEAVKLNWHSGKFQSSETTLMGVVKAGEARPAGRSLPAGPPHSPR